MVYILGMGPGDSIFFTNVVERILSESDILVGGKRHLDYISQKNNTINLKQKFYIDSNLDSLKDYLKENSDKKISVLASGDPSIYGIGDYIVRNLDDELDINIIPGISSIQYCFSKFKINMNDVFITSSHGRELNYDFIFLHNKIAMLTDKKNGPKEIAYEILKRDLSYKMYVGENLSYENEKFYEGDAMDFIEKREYGMCVVILNK